MVEYTTNPLTGRRIQIGGPTFNRLIMEAYDYLDVGLVRRATAPPIETRTRSYNVETGRIVRHGSRTYQSLMRRGYDIVYAFDNDNSYIVPADLLYEALWEVLEPFPDISLSNLRKYQHRSKWMEEENEDDVRVRMNAKLNTTSCQPLYRLSNSIEKWIMQCSE